MENYENDSPTEETTIRLNFLLEQQLEEVDKFRDLDVITDRLLRRTVLLPRQI